MSLTTAAAHHCHVANTGEDLLNHCGTMRLISDGVIRDMRTMKVISDVMMMMMMKLISDMMISFIMLLMSFIEFHHPLHQWHDDINDMMKRMKVINDVMKRMKVINGMMKRMKVINDMMTSMTWWRGWKSSMAWWRGWKSSMTWWRGWHSSMTTPLSHNQVKINEHLLFQLWSKTLMKYINNGLKISFIKSTSIAWCFKQKRWIRSFVKSSVYFKDLLRSMKSSKVVWKTVKVWVCFYLLFFCVICAHAFVLFSHQALRPAERRHEPPGVSGLRQLGHRCGPGARRCRVHGLRHRAGGQHHRVRGAVRGVGRRGVAGRRTVRLLRMWERPWKHIRDHTVCLWSSLQIRWERFQRAKRKTW